MSADNGVYILKTNDGQFRVGYAEGYGCIMPEDINSEIALSIWGNQKYTRDERKAYQIAYGKANSVSLCEYGVQMMYIDKTWNELISDGVVDVSRKSIMNGVSIMGNLVSVNGQAMPPCPADGEIVSIVGNRIFMDGYELINGKWKRTLRAILHLLF